jgi:peptidoglycan/LPS O-acetylase OafA/YrhL
VFCFENGLLGDSPYIFGEFFTGYTYSHMHPGMGIALMISLFTGGWLVFVKREENWKSCRYFAIGGCLSLVLSLFKLHNTSMLFFGLAQLFLCIPGACAIQKCRKEKNKFLSIAIPLMVLAACIGLAVYQGNTLMYARYALIEAQ